MRTCPPKYQLNPNSGTLKPAPSAALCTAYPPPSEAFPAEVFGFEYSVHVEDAMSYSHVATGDGDVEGESLNSPPYSQSESQECHKYPSATAGGPDGWGSPVNAGEAIFHVSVRSKVRKSLSGALFSKSKPYEDVKAYSKYF